MIKSCVMQMKRENKYLENLSDKREKTHSTVIAVLLSWNLQFGKKDQNFLMHALSLMPNLSWQTQMILRRSC